MQDSFGSQAGDQGVLQQVVDQLEELVVTIIEEIRERPGVAAAILAAVVGVMVGSFLAARGTRRASPARKVVRQARGMAEAGDLAALGVKLLQNPIVRGYVTAAVQKQLKNRFSR